MEVDGIQISYLDRPGSPNTPDTPTVVFVHGFTSQKLGWVPLIRFLPTSWRIIAIDLPGHGESGVADDWDCSVKNIGSLLHKVGHKREGKREINVLLHVIPSCINSIDLSLIIIIVSHMIEVILNDILLLFMIHMSMIVTLDHMTEV